MNRTTLSYLSRNKKKILGCECKRAVRVHPRHFLLLCAHQSKRCLGQYQAQKDARKRQVQNQICSWRKYSYKIFDKHNWSSRNQSFSKFYFSVQDLFILSGERTSSERMPAQSLRPKPPRIFSWIDKEHARSADREPANVSKRVGFIALSNCHALS